MLAEFKTLQASDGVVQRIQRNIADAFARLVGKNGNPLLDYTRVEEVALSATPTPVPHKLGRKPLGWLVTRRNASATVYETSDPDFSRLTLAASAPVTIDLYVF